MALSRRVVQDMPLVDSDVDIECEHFETRQMSAHSGVAMSHGVPGADTLHPLHHSRALPPLLRSPCLPCSPS